MKKYILKMLSCMMAALMLVGSFAILGVSAADEADSSKFLSGTKVYENKYDKAQSFEESGMTKYNEASVVELTQNGMILTPDGTGANVMKITDYAPSTTDKSAYTIVMRVSMDAAIDESGAESKKMMGIAYNIVDGKNFSYATLRSSGHYDLNRTVGGSWQSGMASGSSEGRNVINFYDYASNQEYELIVRVYSDGKIRMILDGAVTYAITDNLRDGTGVGVYFRQSLVTVKYLAIYEDSNTNSADDPPTENLEDEFGDLPAEEETTVKAEDKETTAAATKKVASTTAAEEEKSGCGSTVVALPVLMLGAVGVTVVSMKRKED